MRRWGPDEQGARDAATLLPIAAAILLLPPVIVIFTAPVLVAGIPLIALYIFLVWALAIFGAWLIARNHARASGGADTSETGLDETGMGKTGMGEADTGGTASGAAERGQR